MSEMYPFLMLSGISNFYNRDTRILTHTLTLTHTNTYKQLVLKGINLMFFNCQGSILRP